MSFTYLQKDPAEINVKATFYNLHNVIDWLPPYTPGPAKLRILLRCTASYLSRGNVSGPLDAWIEAVESKDFGAKVAVRTALRAGGDLDTVTLSIEKAREMLSGMDYLEEKARLAQTAALKLDQWSSDYAQADGLPNQVVRGTISKLDALQTLDFLIAENEASFWMFRQFLTREPLADEFEGVKLLYGRNCFIQDLDEANIGVAIQEGRDQNMRAGLRTAEPRLINKLRDISYFEVKFMHLMELYASIKNLKQEEEEMNLNRQRLCTYLRKDLIQFHQEVCWAT